MFLPAARVPCAHAAMLSTESGADSGKKEREREKDRETRRENSTRKTHLRAFVSVRRRNFGLIPS